MNKKIVYLTIDDGPSEYRKEKVDILCDRNIQAIWFSNGLDLVKEEEAALYTIQKGHLLGNHSYSHKNFSKISLDECFKEIAMNDKIINEIYIKAKLNWNKKYFRFPYGDKGGDNNYFKNIPFTEKGFKRKEKIQIFLKDLGYYQPEFTDISYNYFYDLKLHSDSDWFWTYDINEWNLINKSPVYPAKSIEDVFDLMDVDLPENWFGLNFYDSSDIILLHDHPETSDYFRLIIDELLQKGIVFKSIP